MYEYIDVLHACAEGQSRRGDGMMVCVRHNLREGKSGPCDALTTVVYIGTTRRASLG